MKEVKIHLNYCVIGKYDNNLYVFYKKDNKMNYKKIINLELIDSINNASYYNIITNKYIFKNVICNRRIYSSINNINILEKMALNIIDNSFGIYSML